MLRVTWWPNLADVAVLVVLLAGQMLPFLGFAPGTDPVIGAAVMYAAFRLVQGALRVADDATCLLVPAPVSRGILAVAVTLAIGAAVWLLWDLTGPVMAVLFGYWLRKAAVKAGLSILDIAAVVTGWSSDRAPLPAHPEPGQPMREASLFDVPNYSPPTFVPPAYQA